MRRVVAFFAVASCFLLGGASIYAAPQDGQYGRQQNKVKDFGKLFDQADANNDGVLARKEAETTPTLSNHFNGMDLNQDGEVTREEMVASMKMKKRHHGRNIENLRW